MKKCLNCNQEILPKSIHCIYCGQKVMLKNLSMWSIFKDFFSNLFNIETKIWRTLRDIWKPAKLTNAFISGKRVTYYNPIRIFIIALFSFVALFLYNIKDNFQSIEETFMTKKNEIWRIEFNEKYDSISIANNWPDSINQKVKEQVLTISPIIDTSEIVDSTDTISQEKLVENDTLINDNVNTPETRDSISFNAGDGAFNINLSNGKIFGDITFNQLFQLSENELNNKLVDKSWIERNFVLQIQKVILNFSDMLQFFIGNGTWIIIALILLMSGFHKIIYWRSNYLYAEHFIFHVYGHTRMLLIGIIGLLLQIYVTGTNHWYLLWILIGAMYLFLDMYKFYRQSKTITTLKFILANFMYNFFVSICIIISLGLSFLLF